MKENETREYLTRIRRELHRYPEPGWLEYRTSLLIAEELSRIGCDKIYVGAEVTKGDSRMGLPSDKDLTEHFREVKELTDNPLLKKMEGGFTGVIGELDLGEGPVIALRFDIDALKVTESDKPGHKPFAEGFVSENPGVMHACGHDCHGAIGLGVARRLHVIKDSLRGKIRFIFQPAEEGCRGAASIVAKGWLEDVDYCIACHVEPVSDYDGVEIEPGGPEVFGSATTKYDAEYFGVSSHAGGAPEEGRNALLAAANAALGLYGIPRNSRGYTRINVGTLISGSGRNVIPDHAVMELEVRGETEELNSYMRENAERILKSSGDMYGVGLSLRKVGEGHPMTNDRELRLLCAETSRELGFSCYDPDEIRSTSGTAEDFGDMMKRVQEQGGKALYFKLRYPSEYSLHNSCMDVDEEVMVKAVRVFCHMVQKLCKESQ